MGSDFFPDRVSYEREYEDRAKRESMKCEFLLSYRRENLFISDTREEAWKVCFTKCYPPRRAIIERPDIWTHTDKEDEETLFYYFFR